MLQMNLQPSNGQPSVPRCARGGASFISLSLSRCSPRNDCLHQHIAAVLQGQNHLTLYLYLSKPGLFSMWKSTACKCENYGVKVPCHKWTNLPVAPTSDGLMQSAPSKIRTGFIWHPQFHLFHLVSLPVRAHNPLDQKVEDGINVIHKRSLQVLKSGSALQASLLGRHCSCFVSPAEVLPDDKQKFCSMK